MTRASLVIILALAAAPAFAQTPSGTPGGTPSGTGPETKDPSQIQIGEQAVLPDAGRSAPSAAPTMVQDCVANPASCRGDGPVKAPSPAAAGMPAQSK